MPKHQHLPNFTNSQQNSHPPNQNQQPTMSISNITKAYLTHRKKGLKSSKMLQAEENYNEFLRLRETLAIQYKSLMEFYETNEEKLRRIIQKQLNENNNYLYNKELMAFIRLPKHQVVKTVNFELFCHDLSKLTLFLSNFNAKKRIKQVEIIKEAMLSREMMIRESSSHEEYEDIYKNMRIPLKTTGFTIYDQYKNIRADHNLPLHSDNIHERLYNKMCDAQECVNNVMKKQTIIKERQKMHILGLSIPKDTST